VSAGEVRKVRVACFALLAVTVVREVRVVRVVRVVCFALLAVTVVKVVKEALHYEAIG